MTLLRQRPVARLVLLSFSLTLHMAACGKEDAPPAATPQLPVPGPTESSLVPVPTSAVPGGEPLPNPTDTAVPLTPTPSEPLAAVVNDQPIFLSTYAAELARVERAQQELNAGAEPAENYRAQVLNSLIERRLIAQAAAATNLTVTPEIVDQQLAELRERAGGDSNFAAWLEANQWTEEEFREALAEEMLTAQIVSHVTANVPFAVEQVRARYLQVEDGALAQSLLDQIRGGADFGALAQTYSLDRITGENGGDLGFFARGTLLVPEVEVAAFALEVGQASEIVAVASPDGAQTTYYLVQVIEKDPQRTLTADERANLLRETFEAWLADLWARASIVRYVDTGA